MYMQKRSTVLMSKIFVFPVFLLMVLFSVTADSPAADPWRHEGPHIGGRLSGIVPALDQPDKLLVSSPGGGVWSTKNDGRDWGGSLMNDPNVYTLARDVIKPNTYYAVTPNNIYVNGLSIVYGAVSLWKNLTNITELAPLWPDRPPTADCAPFEQMKFSDTQRVLLWSGRRPGLYYSFDGRNFTHHLPFPNTPNAHMNRIMAIAADPLTGYVYISCYEPDDPQAMPKVYRSAQPWKAGIPSLEWNIINDGLMKRQQAYRLAWAGSEGKLVAMVYHASYSEARAYFYSETTGKWQVGPTFPAGTSGPWGPLVYAGGNQLFLGSRVLLGSKNMGMSWREFWQLQPTGKQIHADVRGIAFGTYQDPTRNYVWVATDGINNIDIQANIARWLWSDVIGINAGSGIPLPAEDLPVWQAYCVVPVVTPWGLRLFAGSQDNGALCSDRKLPWSRINVKGTWTIDGAPNNTSFMDIFAIVGSPSNPDYMYCFNGKHLQITKNARYVLSSDKVRWERQTIATPAFLSAMMWNKATMAVHPKDPKKLYIAAMDSVQISTDEGKNFLKSVLPHDYRPVSVMVDSKGGIYVGTLNHGAYYSETNGKSWKDFGLNRRPPLGVLKIAYSSADGGTFFMGTTEGLYRKLQGGKFTLVRGTEGRVVNDVEIDPKAAGRVYAAFGFASSYAQNPGDLKISQDLGNTWTSFPIVPRTGISDVEVVYHNSDCIVVCASYGYGIWSMKYVPDSPIRPVVKPWTVRKSVEVKRKRPGKHVHPESGQKQVTM